RELIAQVKHGGLTRRRFVQGLGAFGIGAPMAGRLLGAAGIAHAQGSEPEFNPTRRGGGGTLRILMWDAPTLLHPHFGRGLRDFAPPRAAASGWSRPGPPRPLPAPSSSAWASNCRASRRAPWPRTAAG